VNHPKNLPKILSWQLLLNRFCIYSYNRHIWKRNMKGVKSL